ncbi:restriction endonuclease subunit S [Tenacibaculum soleae]|uniref:restriction endonuclease subunit S n=1 Tax=Tenacibaculum soleae TaxID=447689 RepID=UPI00230109BE|nr:restriction endonuclease subunit S [Tenacibaculum soleae]
MQKEKRLVPKLRFSEFEREWYKNRVGELADFIVPGRNKPKEFNGNIPWITTPDIEHNGIVKVSKKGLSISSEEAKKVGAKIVPTNAIIISCVGELGLTAITGVEMVINQQLHAFIPKEKIENRFLLYSISNQKKYMDKVATKTAVPYMNKDNCNSIPVIYPSFSEQQKIANFLTSIDTQIQILEKKKTLLAQYKKGIMQKIFKQELRFKDDDGNDFAEWEEKKLGEYLTHKSRRNKKLEVTRTLSVSNSKGFVLQSEQFDNHRVASKDVSNYKIVEKNDIAYNPSRINVGSIATLKDFEIGIVSPMYVVFSLKDTLDLTFFENLISTHLFKHLVKVGCSGSVRDSLNFDDLESFKLKIPSLAEQTKIANFLSAIDKNIALVNTKIEHTKSYKKGLLQQMFV